METLVVTTTSGVRGAERAAQGAALTVTNAVWVATALLHRRHPAREAFEPAEIVEEVLSRSLTEGQEDSVWTHVRQHSVGNKKPQPNTACMLFDAGNGLRRLFRRGDPAHEGKNTARTHPAWHDLPVQYEDLRSWYEVEWDRGYAADPLLALAGTWKGERADTYVAKLRAGWEARS